MYLIFSVIAHAFSICILVVTKFMFAFFSFYTAPSITGKFTCMLLFSTSSNNYMIVCFYLGRHFCCLWQIIAILLIVILLILSGVVGAIAIMKIVQKSFGEPTVAKQGENKYSNFFYIPS